MSDTFKINFIRLEGEFVMHKQISLKIPLSASRGLPLALGAFVLGGG
jgi:hypothetical protein